MTNGTKVGWGQGLVVLIYPMPKLWLQLLIVNNT